MPGRPEGAARQGVGVQVGGEAFGESELLAGADHDGIAVAVVPG